MSRRFVSLKLAVVVTLAAAVPALFAAGGLDYAEINKIKAEGMQRSQVMELCSWLSDVYAPRLTGSPTAQKAADWVVAKMKEWGLVNVTIEPWANRNGFERGWTNDKFYLQATAPERFPIPGTPTAWTPGTAGLVSGEVIVMTATTGEELAAYKGKLKGKWVLLGNAPDVPALWEAPAKRFTVDELASMELLSAPQPEYGVAAPGGGRQGGPAAAPGQRAGGPPAGAPAQPGGGRGGAGGAFATARNTLLRTEGALGTFTTAPRGHGVYTVSGNRTADPATTVPAIVIAAEHYGRLARAAAKNVPVVIEADIRNTFHPNPQVFNIVGEIAGTDKADEVVMLGGHFDTWHAATGAADNGVGVAAMMEAMRILRTSGVTLRRTVRVALWGGEEQGLIGSREYVAAHFATRQPLPGAEAGGRGGRGGFGGAQGPLVTKPEYEKLSVYFNIDNGTGALRGVYLQGNDAAAPILREWMEPFRSLGMTTLTIRNTSGTDHQSFDSVGLPGFQFIQDEVEYRTMTHHTNMDTYERLQPGDVTKMATIAAGFAYLAANSEERFPRKPMPAPAATRPTTVGAR